GLLTVFAMWWLYFSKEAHEFLTSLRAAIVWGYGHYLVFASAAGVWGGPGGHGALWCRAPRAAAGPARAPAAPRPPPQGAAAPGRPPAAFTIPVALFLL